MFAKVLLNVSLVLSSILLASSGLLVDCDYTHQTFINIGSVYTCSATLWEIENTKYIVDVSNDHLDGLNHTDVEAIVFQEDVDFTPRGIPSFFPNLLVFRLFNKGSRELTRESLAGLNELRYFDFARNQLEIIQPDLFDDNLLLESIYFELNPIRHVAHNVFDHLNNLGTLYMASTTCINGRADKAEEVNNLIFRLTVSCPPTFAMTEAKIVTGYNLQNATDTRISSKTDPIVELLNKIKEQQKSLQARVDDLENGDNS